MGKFNKKVKGKAKKLLEKEREEFNPSSRFFTKKEEEEDSSEEEIKKGSSAQKKLRKVLDYLEDEITMIREETKGKLKEERE